LNSEIIRLSSLNFRPANSFEFNKENLVYKNQGWNPSKANESASRPNPKKKQKQTINEMMIKDNK
jgi:hypothetical protein